MSALRQEDFLTQEKPKPQRRYLPLRRKPKRNDYWPLGRSFLLLFLLAALIILELSAYALETNLSFQLEEKEHTLEEALNTTRRLDLEIHRQSSLDILEERAVKAGFTRAKPEQYVPLSGKE